MAVTLTVVKPTVPGVTQAILMARFLATFTAAGCVALAIVVTARAFSVLAETTTSINPTVAARYAGVLGGLVDTLPGWRSHR